MAENVRDCVREAELIVTATFASEPVMKATDGLKQTNCHIMAVGAPRPDWAETDPEIWKESLVFVDSFAGAKTEAGDLIQSKCNVENELGAFINKGWLTLHIISGYFSSSLSCIWLGNIK